MSGSSSGGMGSMNGGMTGSAARANEPSASPVAPAQQSACATSFLTDLFEPTEHARCLAQVHPAASAHRGTATSVQRFTRRTAAN
jgi:hypothetical protein